MLTWPIGLANNVLFFVLFYEARLFADMALQAVYFALGCYGWWVWIAGREGSDSKPSRTTRREWIVLTVALPAITLGLRAVLIRSGGAAPFFDALTTALSLAAQLLLARKRVENWALWIATDLIYVPLYLSRGLVLTALLYGVFLAMCIAGWRDWRRVLIADEARA